MYVYQVNRGGIRRYKVVSQTRLFYKVRQYGGVVRISKANVFTDIDAAKDAVQTQIREKIKSLLEEIATLVEIKPWLAHVPEEAFEGEIEL